MSPELKAALEERDRERIKREATRRTLRAAATNIGEEAPPLTVAQLAFVPMPDPETAALVPPVFRPQGQFGLSVLRADTVNRGFLAQGEALQRMHLFAQMPDDPEFWGQPAGSQLTTERPSSQGEIAAATMAFGAPIACLLYALYAFFVLHALQPTFLAVVCAVGARWFFGALHIATIFAADESEAAKKFAAKKKYMQSLQLMTEFEPKYLTKNLVQLLARAYKKHAWNIESTQQEAYQRMVERDRQRHENRVNAQAQRHQSQRQSGSSEGGHNSRGRSATSAIDDFEPSYGYGPACNVDGTPMMPGGFVDARGNAFGSTDGFGF
jgi:hypothetical protein